MYFNTHSVFDGLPTTHLPAEWVIRVLPSHRNPHLLSQEAQRQSAPTQRCQPVRHAQFPLLISIRMDMGITVSSKPLRRRAIFVGSLTTDQNDQNVGREPREVYEDAKWMAVLQCNIPFSL
jgi:hypothetical protein